MPAKRAQTLIDTSASHPGSRPETRVRRPAARDVDSYDVAVVGGGIIGLAVAWRARARGLSVVVLERDAAGAGTSRVAAGMLAPVAEADAGERELLALGLDSAARWPAFAAELEAAGGMEVGYRACGTLVVARDRDEAEALERERALRERLGLRVQRVLPSAARRLEPALAPTLRAALDVPDDHAVDPRLVCEALVRAATAAGVAVLERFELGLLEDLPNEQVVIAAGPWSGAFGEEAHVRPVKGQTLRLRDPGGPGLLDRVVRWGPPTPGYLVPRGDGRYALGATVEERGFDTAVTAGALHELLRDASELVPGVLELEVEETLAGLRPGTPDNAPVIGRSRSDPRVVWATGHHRNGVLLAPVTADLVAAELAHEPVEQAFGPERFQSRSAGGPPSSSERGAGRPAEVTRA
jgi:glycine oxidase